ncbi:Ig-like domain-containing protein [Parabacteroides sp.]
MKKFKFTLLAFMTALISLGFTACSDDDDLKDVSVTGVTITPTALTLKTGTTGTLTATVVPENATVTAVTWNSSDTNVATVDKGVVTAISEGSTTITVKTDDGGFTAACEVTVASDAPAFDESKYHFDLFLTVGKHGGMSSKNTTVVNSIDKLTADIGTITVKGEGTELGDYSMESISKGKYYYQIPSSNDRFVKYQIKDNKIVEITSRPFKDNTYKVRAYSHAWIDDNTLVIMAASGKADQILWTKLNVSDMSILKEGVLDIALPKSEVEGETTEKFSSSGILTYNEKAGKLYYFYFGKNGVSGRGGKTTTAFHTAVINPSDMAVEITNRNSLAAEMAGSAYGQLMQDCVMYDENGDLYLAAFTDANGIEEGHLLRIKNGETDFDPDYEGYPDADGKLLTIQYLGNGKALAYARNDAAGTAIDSYSHYYSIIDLATGDRTRLSYGGKELAYSGGRFSQRSVVFNEKAYFGVNTETDANAVIYIYDTKNGTVEKGAEVAGQFYFDMIRVVEND